MAKQHITALIYDKKGRVLAIGKNSYVKTHPLQAHYAKQVGEHHKIFLHAEIDAIVKCRDIELAHKILITRFDVRNTPKLAKPCKVCEEALRHTKIKHVEYTIG